MFSINEITEVVKEKSKNRFKYLYNPKNCTINDGEATISDIMSICLTECGNRLKGTDGNYYYVGLSRNMFSLKYVYCLALFNVSKEVPEDVALEDVANILYRIQTGEVNDSIGLIDKLLKDKDDINKDKISMNSKYIKFIKERMPNSLIDENKTDKENVDEYLNSLYD